MEQFDNSPEDAVRGVLDDILEEAPSSTNQDDSAPRYPVPNRTIGAVEVPMIVMNLDRTEMAFGNISSFKNVLDPERMSIPFYINPESPFRQPIVSHNAATHNVLLKVTVPKRTGRKRKRGSDLPFKGELATADADADASPQPEEEVCSRSRLDNPKLVRRKLQDNIGKYDVEAVGVIHGTHRFRGLADYHWNLEQSPFVSKFMGQVMPGDVGKMKDFSFIEGVDIGPNVDIIPPPMWTPLTLPFNYHYNQNPYVRSGLNPQDEQVLINVQKPNLVGYLISTDHYPVPTDPQRPPDLANPEIARFMAIINKALEERPIWTRRALFNRVGSTIKHTTILKRYVGFVGYQFRGGPWRDCIVKYGIDPRSDPKYKMYQSVVFHTDKPQAGQVGIPWQAIRKDRAKQTHIGEDAVERQSHIFDGKSFWTDGKVWQVCDVADPLLADLIRTAATRPVVDRFSSGWFHQGRWAKIKAIMKLKMTAIQFGRKLTDFDFGRTLLAGDTTPPLGTSSVSIPLPELGLTHAEKMELYGKRFREPKRPKKGYTVYHPNRADPSGSVQGTSGTGGEMGEVDLMLLGDGDTDDEEAFGSGFEEEEAAAMMSLDSRGFATAHFAVEQDNEDSIGDGDEYDMDEDGAEGIYDDGENEGRAGETDYYDGEGAEGGAGETDYYDGGDGEEYYEGEEQDEGEEEYYDAEEDKHVGSKQGDGHRHIGEAAAPLISAEALRKQKD